MDQKELPNKFYNINQPDTGNLEAPDYVGKMTSEMKRALKAYLEVDGDGDYDDDDDDDDGGGGGDELLRNKTALYFRKD
jgi:hypothetical protein